MKGVAIVAIGNEVLSGLTLNTNASWLSLRLFGEGIPVSSHHVLPDDEKTLLKRLNEIAETSTFVIATGGLGPTIDDITIPIAAKLFGTPIKLPNTVGSAPGLLYPNIVFLPGVPLEMKAIFNESVLPLLKKVEALIFKRVREKVNLCLLPEKAVDPELRRLKSLYPQVDFGIYPQPGAVNVTLTAETHAQLEAPLSAIKEKFKNNIFESETGKIDDAIFQLLTKKGKTVSLAESMTGGTASRRLTLHPGASKIFLGSVVAYSNESKIKLLHVNPQSIEKNGAVSEDVAREMAEGALIAFGSDYSLSITGVAGPSGGSIEKPIGSAWCALAEKGGKTLTWKLEGHATSRGTVMEYATIQLYSKLYLHLHHSG